MALNANDVFRDWQSPISNRMRRWRTGGLNQELPAAISRSGIETPVVIEQKISCSGWRWISSLPLYSLRWGLNDLLRQGDTGRCHRIAKGRRDALDEGDLRRPDHVLPWWCVSQAPGRPIGSSMVVSLAAASAAALVGGLSLRVNYRVSYRFR